MATIGIADVCEDSTADDAPTINISNDDEHDEEERDNVEDDDEEEEDEDCEITPLENRRIFERNDSGTSFSSLISQNSVNTKPIQGPRYKLINEGDIPICKLNHTRTIVSKIMNSRYLRRWEVHKIYLDKTEICSATPTGMMDSSVLYSSIEDVHIVSRWNAGQKFCIRITIPDGSLLMQAHNSYLRDQWLHSILWKRHMYKYEKILKSARRPEVLLKEIKNMIDVSLTTNIQDASIYQFPLDLVSDLLQQNLDFITRVAHENIIVALAPLLENNHPTQEICDFFSKHCKNSPRSSIVIELFTPVVTRILKHNTDFGKFPRMRGFVQEYILALNCQNDGFNVVQNFIRCMHGPALVCPHPRVLPNLVAVCLAAVYSSFEDKKLAMQNNTLIQSFDQQEWEKRLRLYVGMLTTMSTFEDWRHILGSLLQPIPFPNDAIVDETFTS